MTDLSQAHFFSAAFSIVCAFVSGFIAIKMLVSKGDRHGRHRQASQTIPHASAGIPSSAGNGAAVSAGAPTNNPFGAYAALRTGQGAGGVTLQLPPLTRAPEVFGEIIAYRCWRIDAGLLRSICMNNIWIPHEPMKGTIWIEHETCGGGGVHAFKTQMGAQQYVITTNGGLILGASPVSIAFGTVALYGDIVEHEKGYRAEYAMVHEIHGVIYAHGPDATLQNLRALYGKAKDQPTK